MVENQNEPNDDERRRRARARNTAIYPGDDRLRAIANRASGDVISGHDSVGDAGSDYRQADEQVSVAETHRETAEARLVGSIAASDGRFRDLAEQAGVSVDVIARVLHRDRLTVLSRPGCVQCDATARALTKHGIDFTKVDVTTDDEALDLAKGLGYLAVPVVVTSDGDHWSGFRPDRIAELPSLPEPPDAPALVGPAS